MNMIKAACSVFVYIMLSVELMLNSQEPHGTVFSKSSNLRSWNRLIKADEVIASGHG